MAFSTSLANQMKHRDREMVPKVLVVAMFSLMLASLALVSYASITGRAVTSVPAYSDVVRDMSITLDGNRTDGVRVLDADGVQIAHSTENKSGFIDVIWQSVERARKVNGMASGTPVRLARLANGHTVVIDDTTGWKIELIGYGRDNVAAFARLID